MAYGTTVRLGRCTTFEKKSGNRVCNGCDESMFLTPHVAGTICLFFCNSLELAVWISEAEAATSTLC